MCRCTLPGGRQKRRTQAPQVFASGSTSGSLDASQSTGVTLPPSSYYVLRAFPHLRQCMRGEQLLLNAGPPQAIALRACPVPVLGRLCAKIAVTVCRAAAGVIRLSYAAVPATMLFWGGLGGLSSAAFSQIGQNDVVWQVMPKQMKLLLYSCEANALEDLIIHLLSSKVEEWQFQLCQTIKQRMESAAP